MTDAVLALHVQQHELRDIDKVGGVGINEDPADNESGSSTLLITAVDDSENVAAFIFDMSPKSSKTIRMHQTNIKKASGDTSVLNGKHLFGMGYPYFICGYANHIAVSSDYGICVLRFGSDSSSSSK